MNESQNNLAEERFSIGKASKYLNVSIDTLRRWEKKGKIIALRSPGGHRYFLKRDLDMLFGTKYERDETVVEPVWTNSKNEQITVEDEPESPQATQVAPQPEKIISQAFPVPAYDSPPFPFVSVSPPAEKANYEPPASRSQETAPTNSRTSVEEKNEAMPLVSNQEPPSPPKTESNLSAKQKEMLEQLLKTQKSKKDPTKIFKYIVFAIIILAIVNIVILYFWRTSNTIVSPIP